MRYLFLSMCIALLSVGYVTAAGPVPMKSLPETMSHSDDCLMIRSITGIRYYDQADGPFHKAIYIEEGRVRIVGHRFPTVLFQNPAYRDKTGKEIAYTLPVTSKVSRDRLKLALTYMEKLIRSLTQAERRFPKSAPVRLISRMKYRSTGDILFDINSPSKVMKMYDGNPSRLMYVVRLESALLQKQMGNHEDYVDTILQAYDVYDKQQQDDSAVFTGDVFRKTFPSALQFERPEACLLFMAGKVYHNKKQYGKSIELYSRLIREIPYSPYAWEAYVNLKALSDTGSVDKMDHLLGLRDVLIDTYPAVWGYRWVELTGMTKKQFSVQFSDLIKQAIRLKNPEKNRSP